MAAALTLSILRNAVVGSIEGLGHWRLQDALLLRQEQPPGE